MTDLVSLEQRLRSAPAHLVGVWKLVMIEAADVIASQWKALTQLQETWRAEAAEVGSPIERDTLIECADKLAALAASLDGER